MDYEIVDEKILTLGDMLPVCTVKTAGELVADFAEKKEALKKYMKDRYGELVVNEDTLSDIKKDLAELRKVEKKIGEVISKAQKEFDAPIQITLNQANEFKQIVTDTIKDLAEKQKAIDENIQSRKLEENKQLLELIIGTYPDEIQTFARQCAWIQKEQWKNKTYSERQVKADVEKAIADIRLALQIFKGKYRAQALDQLKATGNLSLAQEFISRLEEADRKQAEYEQKVKEAAEKSSVTQAVGSADAQLPASEPEEASDCIISHEGTSTIAENATVQNSSPAEDLEEGRGFVEELKKMSEEVIVSAPYTYCRTENECTVCAGIFVVKGKRGAINWLIDMSVIADLDMRKASDALILKKAEIIKSKMTEKGE